MMAVLIRLALACAAGWGAGWMLTRLSIALARKHGIVSAPNRRTSHEGAVPRIGGIGIAVPFVLACGALAVARFALPSGGGEAPAWARYVPEGPLLWSLFLGGSGAFFLGLWDDWRSMPAALKLVLQWLVAAIPIACGIRLAHWSLPGVGWWRLAPLLGILLGWLWIVFWMNAYNFMDGINGIAGRFGEIIGLALLLIMVGSRPGEELLVIFLVGGCAGFLRWNAPTARTFMGDCGSQFLGFLFGVWTLHLPQSSESLWINTQTGSGIPERAYPMLAMLLVTLPFAWDVVYTLFYRLSRGENLLEAHRSHLYQRLLKTGRTHEQVLSVCEKTFYVCALAGVFMARWTTPADVLARWGSLALGLGTLTIYTVYVLSRERIFSASSSSPDSPGCDPPAIPPSRK